MMNRLSKLKDITQNLSIQEQTRVAKPPAANALSALRTSILNRDPPKEGGAGLPQAGPGHRRSLTSMQEMLGNGLPGYVSSASVRHLERQIRDRQAANEDTAVRSSFSPQPEKREIRA